MNDPNLKNNIKSLLNGGAVAFNRAEKGVCEDEYWTENEGTFINEDTGQTLTREQMKELVEKEHRQSRFKKPLGLATEFIGPNKIV